MKMKKTMELNELINEALKLTKKDKTKLINELLASMSDKDSNPMPVYRALEVFGETYKRFKGTAYCLGKADLKWMKELLCQIKQKMIENPPVIITDDLLVDTLCAFLASVRNMPNQWYFENRFTPEGLSKDFQKIYGNLFKKNSYERTKTAFDYL